MNTEAKGLLVARLGGLARNGNGKKVVQLARKAVHSRASGMDHAELARLKDDGALDPLLRQLAAAAIPPHNDDMWEALEREAALRGLTSA